MPFQKGHKGYKKPGKYNTDKPRNKFNKSGRLTLDTHFTSISRFEKMKRGESYLDPEIVDYYLNNNLDITELLDD